MPRPAAFSVQLPQPCQQSWEAMTPTAAGRHCAACQHEVVDFTAFTDGELAAYLARPGKLPCGRFRASQLGRVLLPAAAPVTGWRRWLGAAAALLGLGALATPARAQQGRPPLPATAQRAGHQQQTGKPARPARRATHPRPHKPGQVPPEPVILGGVPILQEYPDSLSKPKN